MLDQTLMGLMVQRFQELFHDDSNALFFFAPGRVNLIGEHTDYNGGYVFPCAITHGTYAYVKKTSDKKVRYHSVNLNPRRVYEINVDEIKEYDKTKGWTNYPNGMIQVFQKCGYPIEFGLDIVIGGNIPVGSGLSSSASLLVLMGDVLRYFGGYSEITNQDLAIYGQRVENEFIGVKSGIMDEFAIAMGKQDHAIYLDTATLKYEYVPVELGDYKLVVMSTNKKRGLHDSKYNERVEECSEALHQLQQKLDITNLGEVDVETFEQYKGLIENEIILKRARHVVTEINRTKEAVRVLKEGNLERFGELMNQSHISLRDDYEVSGKELDTLVENAWKQKGVIGARMTGAGFGGCAIAIVHQDYIDSFLQEVGEAYQKAIGYEATFLIEEVAQGPHRIQ